MDILDGGLFDLFGDGSALMLAALVFLTTAGLAFLTMVGVHSRGAVKRRAAGINAHSGTELTSDQNPLRQSSQRHLEPARPTSRSPA